MPYPLLCVVTMSYQRRQTHSDGGILIDEDGPAQDESCIKRKNCNYSGAAAILIWKTITYHDKEFELETIMRKLNLGWMLGVAALLLGLGNLQAQPAMDPQQMQQQMQQRMMEFFREQLVVTNDQEWTVIQGRLSKVMQSKMESLMGSMGGLRGMMGRNRGNDGQGGGRRGMFGLAQPDPEVEALQRVLEAKAPTDQIKAALTKLRESRKRKEAELAKAQDQLREVLSFRQEAVLVSLGMLD